MKNICTFILISIFLCSCFPNDPKQQTQDGEVKGNYFTNDELGWTIEIPDGWKITPVEQSIKNTQNGLKKLEGAFDPGYTASTLKHLIGFSMDKFNSFQSTIEDFNVEESGDWDENNEYIKDVLYKTYTNRGIVLDTTSSVIIVDGLSFKGYHITLFDRNGKVLLNQDMYSRFMNGYDFGVVFNYKENKYKNELLRVWKNSKFKK